MLAERRRLGLDLFDEVWDGEYHMVPSPNNEHQRLGGRLFAALLPIADAAGLDMRYEMNLVPPEEPGFRNFRVPDLVVYRPELGTDRGVDGPAALAVEIRSPRDESFKKLPFYEQLGVGEVLIIDRDTKVVRRWVNGPSGLTEVEPDATGAHALLCLPVTLRMEHEGSEARLVVESPGSTTTI